MNDMLVKKNLQSLHSLQQRDSRDVMIVKGERVMAKKGVQQTLARKRIPEIYFGKVNNHCPKRVVAGH